MKLAITGKGGVGKTTLASTLARLYADEGRPVLAADVDPDANLGLALGMSQEEVDSIVPISKMRTLVEERTGANEANKFFKLNPFVSDIPEKYAHEVNGVKLLTAKLDGVPVAGTYHTVEQNPHGVGDVLKAAFSGFYDAVDVCIFILMVGGFLGVVMKTGAVDAGVGNVIRLLGGREKWLIPF